MSAVYLDARDAVRDFSRSLRAIMANERAARITATAQRHAETDAKILAHLQAISPNPTSAIDIARTLEIPRRLVVPALYRLRAAKLVANPRKTEWLV